MMACLSCAREASYPEQKGHDCGRLDRLGGNLATERTPHDTAVHHDGGLVCRVCGSAELSPAGTCGDPSCWSKLRDEFYPHRRASRIQHPPDLRSQDEKDEDAAREDAAVLAPDAGSDLLDAGSLLLEGQPC